MTNVYDFPGERGSGPHGPDGPMIEARVASLEDRAGQIEKRLGSMELLLAEIKGQLSQMPKTSDYGALRADLAEIKGRLASLPTWWMLLAAMIATWGAGAAIVFALTRIAR